jgi:Na+-driven multidrug efflux pump
LALLAFLVSRRSLVRPTLRDLRLQPTLFLEILRVGAPGSLNTLLTNLTVVVLTSLVGPFGGAALAGYGLGARLEYLQIPIVFGLGSALVTMVGTSVGAGNRARALRVAWAGTAMAAAVTSVIGILAALFPHAWLGLFTTDPDVLAAGSRYLRMVGPFYGFFGAGLALYFASQGAGRLLWPLTATLTRLMIAGVGGWLATRWLGGGLTELFAAMAVALMTFGMMNVAAVRVGSWRRSS